MDTFEDTSDPPTCHSQPTQILKNVLAFRSDPGSKGNDPSATGHVPANDSSFARDFSDSSTSYPRDPAPKYHFHGLATTQTQTQHEDGEAMAASQKENAPASPKPVHHNGPLSRPQSPSPFASSSKSRGSHITNAMGHPSSRPTDLATRATGETTTSLLTHSATPLRSKSTMTAALQSSRGAGINPTNLASTRSLPSRSNSPRKLHRSPSQDSFAGGVSQDPERQFLATTKQFDVPLSELGRVSIEEDTSTETPDTTVQPQGASGLSSLNSSMFAYPGQGPLASSRRSHVPSSSPNHGQVLVAATPSNSGSSQSQSQPSQQYTLSQDPESFFHRQPSDAPDDDMPQDDLQEDVARSEASTQPSSSYERLINGGPMEGTQEDLEATQPTGSVEFDSTVPMDEEDSAAYRSNISATPAPPTPIPSSVPSTTGRSLLGMVNPAKRWKIEALQQRVGHAVPIPNTPSVIQDTQPSDLDDHPSWGKNERPLVNTNPFFSRAPVRRDAMEVILDSEEPPMDAMSTSSTRRPVSSGVSPLKRTFRSIDEDSEPELGSGDIVPDSLAVEEKSEGEEEDDEDDVPLASAIGAKLIRKDPPRGISSPREGQKPISTAEPRKTNSTKGIQRAEPQQTTKPRGSPVGPDMEPPLPPARRPGAMQYRTGRSWETRVVPSSAPDEVVRENSFPDAPPIPTLGPSGPSGGKSALKYKTAKLAPRGMVPGQRARSTSTAPASKRQRVSSDTEDDEMDIITQKDSKVISSAEKEEEETELADEDSVELDERPNAGRSSGKRKRSETIASRAVSRVSTRASKFSESTPVPRSTKRLRSVASGSRAMNEPATRVFALWKQDGHYYSGTIHSLSTGANTRYVVKFDDETEDIVDISKMRTCELIVDDTVILIEGSQKATVVDVSRRDTRGLVGVEVDDGGELDRLDVEPAEVRIAGKTLVKQWSNRTLTADSIVTIVKPKRLKVTPSPSKVSATSGASVRSGASRALYKTGVVVTLSVGKENWEKEKNKAVLAVERNGGTVFDDWSQVFPMNGKHSHSGHRWVIHQDDVKWSQMEGIEKVFLLADDANQKPKFLIALALGIPCISTDWLNRCNEDWQPHLLPAGYSDPLHARVSQMVDLDWGNSIEHLNDIMSNPVASKLFSGYSILCLGPDFVPLAKPNRNNSEAQKNKEATRMVPRIILAMGASRVEAASEKRYASDQGYTSFDYIVVKDACDVVRGLPDDVTCVPVPWIKQCLIAGRSLPLQDW